MAANTNDISTETVNFALSGNGETRLELNTAIVPASHANASTHRAIAGSAKPAKPG
jgi:hypothetical protein